MSSKQICQVCSHKDGRIYKKFIHQILFEGKKIKNVNFLSVKV